MIWFRLAALAATLALGACSTRTPAAQVAPQHVRIVSLMPSLTEDLCAIGAEGQLVGVSAYSNDVPCAKDLPVVGDFSSVDAEKVVGLHPGLVVGIPSQQRAVESLGRAGVNVELLRDDSYDDLFNSIARLGALTGRDDAAKKLNNDLRAQTAQLRATTHAFVRRPTVFVALGTGPIYTAGPNSYISTLIGLAGGRNAVTSLGNAYDAYSPESLLQLQPDAIVSDNAVGLNSVLTREPWRSLRAVQQHHVWILSDAALLERPGPRYNEGLAWLIARLTPLAK